MGFVTQNGIEVHRCVWYTEGGGATRPIGIVLGRNSVGEWRAFIGTGAGFDERADIEHIAAWGASIDVDAAAFLSGDIQESET